MATHRLRWTDPLPAAVQRGAVTFGNFDGVHRGHQDLLNVLKHRAAQVNGPAIAVTFDPPPVALLNPSALKLPLTTIPQRAELLHAAGADQVIVLTTEASLLALSAPAFIEDVIQLQLNAAAIVEGSNFRFGRGRAGNNEALKATGIAFEEVPVPVDAVSSSRVRDAINAGDVTEAAALLGRPYSIIGTVVEGAKRGRTLGVPTANLDHVPTLLPAVGVYAGRVTVKGVEYAVAANIGPNPTFGEDARKIEVHVIGFDADLYGQTLSVQFVKRLRDTVPFKTIDELKRQLMTDIAAAKSVCAIRRSPGS
ncbi:bifunctional riboflavin kinase/FAD synthetase [soil metagenome]